MPPSSTLYTACITNRLDDKYKGVMIGTEKITHLSYADDIVVIADTEDEILNMISHLIEITEQLHMAINFEKSKIMYIGCSNNDTLNEWEIYDDDKIIGKIEQKKEYKYLGIIVNHSRSIHNKHIENKLKKMRFMQMQATVTA